MANLVDLSFLPLLNAVLNSIATVLLVAGRVWIHQRRVDAHRRAMLGAFAVSTLFLASYLAHKVWKQFENTTFNVEGFAKLAYLVMLASHVMLAAAVPVMAIALIRYGLTGRIDQHRRLARIAWPMWLYVSITGVVIYLLLYPFNPPPGLG